MGRVLDSNADTRQLRMGKTLQSGTSSDLANLETEALERSQIELSDLVVSPSRYMLDWYRGNGVNLPKRLIDHQLGAARLAAFGCRSIPAMHPGACAWRRARDHLLWTSGTAQGN